MNLPNKLTMLRVLLIPIMIIFLMKEYYSAAAAVFMAASITDAFDGHIARSRNLITDFGKLMDPLADKLLVVSALVCLVQLGDVQGWMVIVILAREILITGLRGVAASSGKVIAAAKSGKLKTITQMLAVILILLKKFPCWPFTAMGIKPGTVMLWIAVFMTVYSGVEYVLKNGEVFRDM